MTTTVSYSSTRGQNLDRQIQLSTNSQGEILGTLSKLVNNTFIAYLSDAPIMVYPRSLPSTPALLSSCTQTERDAIIASLAGKKIIDTDGKIYINL